MGVQHSCTDQGGTENFLLVKLMFKDIVCEKHKRLSNFLFRGMLRRISQDAVLCSIFVSTKQDLLPSKVTFCTCLQFSQIFPSEKKDYDLALPAEEYNQCCSYVQIFSWNQQIHLYNGSRTKQQQQQQHNGLITFSYCLYCTTYAYI